MIDLLLDHKLEVFLLLVLVLLARATTFRLHKQARTDKPADDSALLQQAKDSMRAQPQPIAEEGCPLVQKGFDTGIQWFASKFLYQNPLHVGVFRQAVQLERQALLTLSSILGGGVGTITTGRQQNAANVLQAYKNLGVQKGITQMQILLPANCHPCYYKCCHYYGITFRQYQSPEQVPALIGPNTLVVIVYPSDPLTGAFVDLKKFSRIGVPVHVDASQNGFFLAFSDLAAAKGSRPTFQHSWVDSICVDFSELGPTCTGAIFYRDRAMRRRQFYVMTNWAGGLYGTIGMSGSRSGTTAALAWYSMAVRGRSGFLERTRVLEQKTKTLRADLLAKDYKVPESDSNILLVETRGDEERRWGGQGLRVDRIGKDRLRLRVDDRALGVQRLLHGLI